MTVINLDQLDVFSEGTEVTPELLQTRGLLRGKGRQVKILADGVISKALTVKAHAFSAKAKEKIEASGGKAELVTAHA
jgi:large subunit ribosomal protein L15